MCITLTSYKCHGVSNCWHLDWLSSSFFRLTLREYGSALLTRCELTKGSFMRKDVITWPSIGETFHADEKNITKEVLDIGMAWPVARRETNHSALLVFWRRKLKAHCTYYLTLWLPLKYQIIIRSKNGQKHLTACDLSIRFLHQCSLDWWLFGVGWYLL